MNKLMAFKKDRRFHQQARILVPALAAVLLLPIGSAYAADGGMTSEQASLTTAATDNVAQQAGDSGLSSAGAGSELPEGAKITKDEAVAKLKALFPEMQKAEVQQVNFGEQNSYPPRDMKIWDIQWTYQDGNNGYGFSTRIDARNGDVLSVHYPFEFNKGNEVYYPPKVSKEEAMVIAKSFIAKASPTIDADQLEEQNVPYPYYDQEALFGPVRYDATFQLKVNGIDSAGDTIHVVVDGNGKIIDYEQSYLNDDYPDNTPKITEQQAEQRFMKDFDLQLAYYPIRGGSGVKDWFLGWQPKGSIFNIDAATGQYVSPDGQDIEQPKTTYSPVPDEGVAFSAIRSEDGDYLSAEQAEAAVKQVVDIPDDDKLFTKSLQNDYQNRDQKVWYLSWREQDQLPYGGGPELSARVDASTGQVLQYGAVMYPPMMRENADQTDTDQQPSISDSQARDRAMKLIRAMYPDAADELQLVENNWQTGWMNDSQVAYPFQFQRFYKGVPVNGDRVSLSLDKHGKILSYYVNRTMDLPDKLKDLSASIDKEQARKLYLDQSSMNLIYGNYQTYDGKKDSYIRFAHKLVYARLPKDHNPSLGQVIDASTGKWRSTWTPTATSSPAARPPQDIQGSWAEDALAALVKYGVLVPDDTGKIYPDRTVTLGDWLAMAATAVSPQYEASLGYDNGNSPALKIDKDDPHYAAVRFADRMGWLDAASVTKDRLDRTLTRADMAKWIAAMLHYPKLSAFLTSDLDYSDNDKIQEKGDVRIVSSLGIMTGSDGYFHPDQLVTRAEAAEIMMQLVRLQGKTDFPVTQNR